MEPPKNKFKEKLSSNNEFVKLGKGYKLKEQKETPKKMTVKEVCGELGYDVEIVKE